jgi:hypothetical protein
MQWSISARPARSQVPAKNLKGEIYENSDSKIFFAEALLDHLETGSRVMRGPSNFGGQVHKKYRLDI